MSERRLAALGATLRRHLAEGPQVAIETRPDACTVTAGPEAHRWEVHVAIVATEAVLTARGQSPESRRALRNALIGRARLSVDPDEHHVLARMPVQEPAVRRDVTAVADLAARWVVWLDRAVRRTPVAGGAARDIASDEAAVYWWDERANFGDAIGPWLVRQISGREPVNARRRRSLRPALFGVGSILGLIDRNDVDVWGAGLMEPLTGARLDRLREKRDVRVRAVRGRLTRQELVTNLGWDVPEVFGDPGLLLPAFYTPERPAQGPARAKVAFVPHYVHRAHFAAADRSDDIVVVDARENLERVVDQIAAADACVSSSLHGVIIAQAYGVPWVWLRVADRPLGGDTFKFADFFSTLDEAAVARHDVRVDEIPSLDLVAVAERASLPSLEVSLDALLDAFPISALPGAGHPFVLPPLPRRRRPFAVAAVASRLRRVRRGLPRIRA